MQSVWEADNDDFRKRKRVAKACEACQRKKKRCTHVFKESDENRPRRPSVHLKPSVGDEDSHESHPERWLSDLLPEAHLRDEKNPSAKGSRRVHIGVFLKDRLLGDRSSDEDNFPAISGQQQSPEPDGQHIPRRVGRAQLRAYLEAAGSFRVLPDTTQKALVEIFLTQVQPLVPILDADSFQKAFKAGKASRLLVNAICLVSCKAQAAASHLRITPDGPSLPVKEFASVLYNGLVAANYARLEAGRITRVRILALMSMHCEGVQGVESSSMHLIEAIHIAEIDAIHINFSGRKENNDTLAALFWSLWAIDKINTAETGRPVTIEDRDIGITRSDRPEDARRRPFDVLYDISTLLQKIFELYRPTSPVGLTGWEEDYPSFEAIVGENLEDGISESTFAMLELYYQAVTIVACRADSPGTPSYSRQALAALRIQTLMTIEHATDLAPLPLVQYAVSLALSVAYRQWRKAEIPSLIRTAKSNLRICTEVLEKLSETWDSAVAMASLSRMILERSDKGEVHGSTQRRKERVPPDDAPALSSASNSLDILSSAAEAHSRSRPNSDPVLSRADDEHGFSTGYPTTTTIASNDDFLQTIPDNLFEDFDAYFHSYMDVGLPQHYEDVDLWGNNDDMDHRGLG